MVLVLAQVSESSSDYNSATIVLLVLFVVSITVTAGLLLKDIMFPESDAPDRIGGWPPSSYDPAEPPFGPDTLHRQPELRPSRPQPARLRHGGGPSPAWFSQAMASQRADAAIGITRTVERLIDASNRGDLRTGFSCYTPEHLARYQLEHEADAGALERLSRMEPVPAEHRISVAAVRDITVDPPHRAYATVDYTADTGPDPPSERFQFHFDQSTNAWLIEAIESLPE